MKTSLTPDFPARKERNVSYPVFKTVQTCLILGRDAECSGRCCVRMLALRIHQNVPCPSQEEKNNPSNTVLKGASCVKYLSKKAEKC